MPTGVPVFPAATDDYATLLPLGRGTVTYLLQDIGSDDMTLRLGDTSRLSPQGMIEIEHELITYDEIIGDRLYLDGRGVFSQDGGYPAYAHKNGVEVIQVMSPSHHRVHSDAIIAIEGEVEDQADLIDLLDADLVALTAALAALDALIPGGANTHVQFNDAGVLAGNAQLTFDKVSGEFSAPYLNLLQDFIAQGDGYIDGIATVGSLVSLGAGSFDGGVSLLGGYNYVAGAMEVDGAWTLNDNADINGNADISGTLTLAGRNANQALVPTGTVLEFSGLTVPSGYLAADGSSVSRTTYADLWAAYNASLGTVTISNASPGVVTLTAHGLAVGDAVYFTTTGGLPTGLSANTTYYVSVVPNANTFQVSATFGGASVNTSSAGSGTHTLIRAPWGIPAGSTTNFYLPDPRGLFIRGTSSTVRLGTEGGSENVTLSATQSGVPVHLHAVGTLVTGTESVDHTHTQQTFNVQTNTTTANAGTRLVSVAAGSGGNATSGRSAAHTHAITGSVANHAGAAAADSHTNMPPWTAMAYIVKI